VLNLQKISHNYFQGGNTVNVIKNLDLSLKKNCIVGLFGPSGSGKSTLLNLIGLIEKPSNGNIFIDNCDTVKFKDEMKTKLRREKISFIFQNNQLLEDFTCLENIALPLLLNGTTFSNSKQKALNLLSKFNLDNKRNYKPALLSGGEQQRISVLRALIKQPKIILADEPTGSLDKLNAKIVMENIIDLSRQLETLTIVATHNVNFLPLFDLSYEIQNGKLVELK
tara:strand:+ start:194 stop:865 length:672 start_codon:yes stop_codon:yes gene_type:complete